MKHEPRIKDTGPNFQFIPIRYYPWDTPPDGSSSWCSFFVSIVNEARAYPLLYKGKSPKYGGLRGFRD